MWISPLLKYRTPLQIASWLTFAISLAFYWITCDPGASYWDCPEYVTVASKMEVGHPPGNPVWMLTMRMATIPFASVHHAYVINLCSGILMAFASFFLCRLIFVPARVFMQNYEVLRKFSKKEADFLCSIIAIGASLCFALCDSAWYSAVEAEVYAMSTFLSALSLWIMMLWWWQPAKGRRIQLLILLAYLMGLSLGVHQLNLLLIPVYALVILYRKKPGRINATIIFCVFFGAVLLIGIILAGMMPGVLFGAGKFELWAVNGLGWPYNSGVLLFCAIILIFFCVAIYLSSSFKCYTPKASHITSGIQYCLWSGAFILLGFSSFGMIMIRSQYNPPMNEGSPDNIFSLSSYISRDQYASTPLLYGSTPYSQPMLKEEFINGKPQYRKYVLKKGKPRYMPLTPGAQLNHRSGFVTKDDSAYNSLVEERGKGYILADYDFEIVMTPELDMWLPRITSTRPIDRVFYEDWAGASEDEMKRVAISQAVDSLGHPVTMLDNDGQRNRVYSYRPTYLQNLQYFVAYQSFYMYFRYLLWNFVGRQNDEPSTGEIDHGNLITGLPLIDRDLLGINDEMPPEIGKDNPGRNRYFGIPFILGIIGIIALAISGRKNRRILFLIFSVFLMTGLAIVVYLNQSPGEARERDYTFLVSYMAFAMWIGAGILAFTPMLIKKLSPKYVIGFSVLPALGTPALMAVENFNDHDRRDRFEPAFHASSLLDYENPAIIFTSGDNSTFPLWYAQEVLGMGNKHLVIDISYLSQPYYIVNLKRQGEKGAATIGSVPQLAYGRNIYTYIPDSVGSKPMPLADALKEMYGNARGEWPTSLVTIPKSHGKAYTIDLHTLSRNSDFLPFAQLMLLDLMASQTEEKNPRVLFFPSSTKSFTTGLDSVLRPALFGRIYAPWMNDSCVWASMQTSVKRELKKLSELYSQRSSLTSHYADPETADHTLHYRRELLIAAQLLNRHGYTSLASATIDAIMKYLPYDKLLPAASPMGGDSIYYEGKEASRLMKQLAGRGGNQKFKQQAASLDSLMLERYNQWQKYHNSLLPMQQRALSHKTKRLLVHPDSI